MRSTLREDLQTAVAITVAPFTPAGDLDETAYAAVLDHLAGGGITALTPNGNTTEFYSLDLAEAHRLMALTVESATADQVVVAGVGHDVRTATRMAEEAQRAGAHAVMVHQPPHPYRSVEGWVGYHQQVAAAAPDLGLVAYVRDPRLDTAALVALAEGCPSLVAIKYAVPSVFALAEAIEAVGTDRVAWICGLAERWAPFFWLAGARGFTSGLANVAPALTVRLLEQLRAGRTEDAMDTWRLVAPMEALRARRGDANNVSAIKEALAQLGLCGREVRLPIVDLEPAEAKEITTMLDDWRGSGGLGPAYAEGQDATAGAKAAR